MKNSLKLVVVLLLTFVSLVSGVSLANADTNSVPILNDSGNMFSPEEEAVLKDTIAVNKDKYGLLFALETVSSLDGQTLEAVSLDRAKELQLGDAGLDNGVLIFLSRDDRKVRFELGTGVSTKISDAEMTAIIDSQVTPAFKANNYVAGVTAGMTAVGDRYTSTTSNETSQLEDHEVGILVMVVILAVILILLFLGHVIWGEDAKKSRQADFEYWKMKQSIKRLEQITSYTSKLKYSDNAVEYKSLPNTEERLAYLSTHYPDLVTVLQKHHSDENPPTKIVDRSFYDDIRGIPLSFTGNSLTPSALRHFYLTGGGFERMSIDEANNLIRNERARVEKEKEKERKKQERARKIWNSIPAPTQKALRAAKTQSDRLALLRGEAANDFAANYAAIASIFLSSSSYGSSSGGSSGGGYSGGSSSSSSSGGGYSSSDYSSGGSFDGGGGSGSW